jgi:hypothetical protein
VRTGRGAIAIAAPEQRPGLAWPQPRSLPLAGAIPGTLSAGGVGPLGRAERHPRNGRSTHNGSCATVPLRPDQRARSTWKHWAEPSTPSGCFLLIAFAEAVTLFCEQSVYP